MGDETMFVNIAIKEGSNDIMELPCEKDGKLLLSTLKAQFANAIGLKYRSSTGGWRGIKSENKVLEPPKDGWRDEVYIITESDALKRKAIDNSSARGKRTKKSTRLLEDLIIQGIPYSTTQEELSKYFSDKCGEFSLCEIKLDRETNKSRGFGFIRFTNEDAAQEALKGQHMLEGRKLEIRLARKKDEVPMKLFIGRLPNGTTEDDVSDYFSYFGDLMDVFVPTNPFRGFGFITYCDQENAHKALRLSHTLMGNRLHVTPAQPKEDVSSKRQENFGVVESYPKTDLRNSYGESRNSYGDSRNSYGESRNSYGESRNSYGESRNSYGESRNSYGESRNSYGKSRNSYDESASSSSGNPGHKERSYSQEQQSNDISQDDLKNMLMQLINSRK